MPLDLILGASDGERDLLDAEAVLARYTTDDGLRCLDYRPVTPTDCVVPVATARAGRPCSNTRICGR